MLYICVLYKYILYLYIIYIIHLYIKYIYIYEYIYIYIYIYIYTSEFRSLDGMSFPVLKFRETVDIVGLRRRVKGKANIKRNKKLSM